MIDVQGSFRMFLVIGSFLGFACIGFGLVGDVLSLGAVFAALRFFGQGAMMMLCATLVAQWFIDRRGLAMSLMALGFAASMALHPPLVNWLAETLGWRSAWYWLGIITWVTVLPLTLLFVHNKPEDVGLLPDGRKPSEDGDRAAQAAAEFGLTRSEALRTKSFWILAAGMFTPAMLITSLFFFQVSIFDSLGLERSLAASTFTITAVMMAVSMPLVGWTLDRLRTRYVFAAALVLLSCSLVTVTFVDGIVMAMIYGAMFGLNNAASITFFSYIWAHYFGRKHIGSVQGVGQMIGVFGASLGPLPLGLAFDMIGSYTEIIRLLAILPLACAVLAMFLKQPETASEQV
jgi:MFS family permease